MRSDGDSWRNSLEFHPARRMAELRSRRLRGYFLDASPQSEDAGDASPEVRQEGLDACVVRMEKHINER